MTDSPSSSPSSFSTAQLPPAWDGVDLMALLALDCIGDGVYCSRLSEDNRNGRVFGGQLLAQALMAACATVESHRSPTALRVLFMRGALSAHAIRYRTEALQDGKRFSSRRVTAYQENRLLIDAHVTFQLNGPGYAHALPPFDVVPEPELLDSMAQLTTQGVHIAGAGAINWASFEKSCLELKVVAPERHLNHTSSVPRMSFWVRLRKRLDDNPATHAAALTYLSDYWVNSAAITYHVPAGQAHGKLYIANLNHALWLHRDGRADDWLLFSCESPSAQDGRALTNGRIYNRQGVLLASLAQECLMSER